MGEQDPDRWMWQRAADLLDRADRLQRTFVRAGARGTRRPAWEPPIDVFESEREIIVIVAMPGIDEACVVVDFDQADLRVTAERRMPAELESAAMRRLEIPQGRFERRIPIPAGRFEIYARRFQAGLLWLRLRKLG